MITGHEYWKRWMMILVISLMKVSKPESKGSVVDDGVEYLYLVIAEIEI